METNQPEDPATAGSFRCSDPGLEKVWEVARDTLRACRQNLHLDSPRHQEMLACAGDYHVESLMEQACFGDLRLAAHDLRSTARMLEATDGLKNYRNAAFVKMPFGDNARYSAMTRESAAYFGWDYHELEGDLGLIGRFLRGDWNEEDFLVLEPGETAVQSVDERILRKADL